MFIRQCHNHLLCCFSHSKKIEVATSVSVKGKIDVQYYVYTSICFCYDHFHMFQSCDGNNYVVEFVTVCMYIYFLHMKKYSTWHTFFILLCTLCEHTLIHLSTHTCPCINTQNLIIILTTQGNLLCVQNPCAIFMPCIHVASLNYL